MRNAFQRRESDQQYREVAEHFARLDIHPVYLTELTEVGFDANYLSGQHKINQNVSEPTSTKSFDWLSLFIATLALSISMAAAGTFAASRFTAKCESNTAQTVTPEAVTRIQQQVDRLAKVLSMLVLQPIGIETTNKIVPNFESSERSATLLAHVIVPKANLRIAPTLDSSAIMAVSSGSTLVVNAQQSDWLEVWAPNGQLTWISANLVSISHSPGEDESLEALAASDNLVAVPSLKSRT